MADNCVTSNGCGDNPGVRVAITAASILGVLPLLVAQGRPSQTPAPFSIVEASISDMRDAMAQGRVTSRQIVQQSLDRIARYEARLNAVITLNPRALAEADALDRERSRGRIRGP